MFQIWILLIFAQISSFKKGGKGISNEYLRRGCAGMATSTGNLETVGRRHGPVDPMSTPNPDTQCVINKTEPAFQPNVYMCYNGSSCCFYRGEATCCARDVPLDQFWAQMVPFIIGFAVLMFIFWFVKWLFGEDSIEEEEHAFYPMDVKKYKGYMMKAEFDSMVDDPVFGTRYAQSVPRLAVGAHQKQQ